jgi:hypothetical protein
MTKAKEKADSFVKEIAVKIPPDTVNWWASDHTFRFWQIREAAAEAGYEVVDVQFIGAEPNPAWPEQLTTLSYEVTYTGGPRPTAAKR